MYWKRDAKNPCQLSYANRTPSAVIRSPRKQSSLGNALVTPWVSSLPYAAPQAAQLPSYTGSFAYDSWQGFLAGFQKLVSTLIYSVICQKRKVPEQTESP